jgi:type I restriction-modification system DNA methylase subunit
MEKVSSSMTLDIKERSTDKLDSEVNKLYDRLLKAGLASKDAKGTIVDYVTASYGVANNWVININPFIDFAKLPESVNNIDTSYLDEFEWEGKSPLILADVYGQCIDRSTKARFGQIYTPDSVAVYMVRSVVVLTLKNFAKSDKKIDWSSLRIEEIEQEESIDKLMAAQKALARIKACDPCCGCGVFLYWMWKELVAVDKAIVARLRALDRPASALVSMNQIHGVDIDGDAIEVSKRVMLFACRELGWHQGWIDIKVGNSLEDPTLFD